MWYIVAAVGLIAIMVVTLCKAARDADKDMNNLQKQMNCPHGVLYRYSGKMLCARCGKTIVRGEEI